MPELVARKLVGPEQAVLTDGDFDTHEREYLRLRQMLEEAATVSKLAEQPVSRAALNVLLEEQRLDGAR